MAEDSMVMAAPGLIRHPQHNSEASSTSLRFWARSIGDRNPRYVRDGYAPEGSPAFMAHPCWLYSVNDTAIDVGAPGEVPIIAGAAWSFERAVVPGDIVSTRSTLLGQRRVQSRHAGAAWLQRARVDYLDPRGTRHASVEVDLLRVDPAAARQAGKHAAWQRWKFTPEQLAAVERDYDAEFVRGAAPLYADEVNVGDAVPPIVRGPVTSEEMTMFTGATRPIASISTFMAGVRDGSVAGFIHPRTGTWETHAAGLIDDDAARQLGFPAAHDYGIDRIAQSCSLVANWMGDHGQLLSLAARLHAPCMLGDVNWFAGRVVAVRCDAETGAVRLEFSGVNQRGDTTLSGQAVVRLPVRPRTGGAAR